MTASTFLFATGIENSYPTINGGRTRIDEMEKCGHYTLWRMDFDLLDEVGIHYLRYGPPIHTTWLGRRCHVNRLRAHRGNHGHLTGSRGSAGCRFPLRHGVEAMKMGGKGRAAGARWHKEIADGRKDTDEALQASR
jgi:hypothetical protein